MNSRIVFLSTASIAIAILMAGCTANSLYQTQSTPPTYAGCKTWEQQAGAASAGTTTVMSADLAKFIGVQEVLALRSATGLAAAQATVYNCSDVDVLLNMRTRFSGDGGQSEPPSIWKNVFLAPRGQATYNESALSKNSTKVSIDINDGNRAQGQFGPGQSYAIPPK